MPTLAETRDTSVVPPGLATRAATLDEHGVGGARSSQANATAPVPDERLARSALGVVWNQRWQLLVSADCSL